MVVFPGTGCDGTGCDGTGCDRSGCDGVCDVTNNGRDMREVSRW